MLSIAVDVIAEEVQAEREWLETEQGEVQAEREWLEAELGKVSLGDKRLDWRLIDVGSKLAAYNSSIITQVSEDWADAKAAYRLFDNEKTTAEKILKPHMERTQERIEGYEQVLAIQDTSYLDYSHHANKEGLGPIGTTKQKGLRGLVLHTTLVTTTAGLPLGVVSQEVWAREEEAKQLTPQERQKLPIEEKESYKWLTAMTETVSHIPAGTQVINVGDSEADIFELFHHGVRELKTDLLIRAGQDRSVCEPEVGRLRATLSKQEIAGHLKVQVPKRDNQPKREAIVSVRYSQVTLRAPRHLRSRLADIPLYAVLVEEEGAPSGVEPLSWLLLTTVPVRSFEEAIERIRWYRHRWQIEVYFKVLKSGCQVEKSQLATTDRLRPLIALLAIIAWRLFWLTHLARHQPDAPCTAILTDHEWRALYRFTHKTDPRPDHIPTVLEATLWIAQLGGFLARRHDGFPGPIVIWRGWRRLQDIAAFWLLFHPPPTCG